MTTGFGGVGYSGQGKILGFSGFKDCSYGRVFIERPNNLPKLLDPEERYREVNSNSRKTWEMISNNIGHRTLEDITGLIKLGACIGFVLMIMLMFWRGNLVFKF